MQFIVTYNSKRIYILIYEYIQNKVFGACKRVLRQTTKDPRESDRTGKVLRRRFYWQVREEKKTAGLVSFGGY